MKIFIWGAGSQGRVVLDILKNNKNLEIKGFIDDNKKLKGKIIDGVKVLGGKEALQKLKKQGIEAGIVAIGNNTIRCELANYLRKKSFRLINAIHPKAIVASDVTMGSNIMVAAGAIICAHSVIENNVVIYAGAIIEHESIIKNGAYLSPGVQLAGRVKVDKKTFIGIGASIIQGVKIGSSSIIGAGSVVLKDVPDKVVVGVPVKIIRKIKEKDISKIL